MVFATDHKGDPYHTCQHIVFLIFFPFSFFFFLFFFSFFFLLIVFLSLICDMDSSSPNHLHVQTSFSPPLRRIAARSSKSATARAFSTEIPSTNVCGVLEESRTEHRPAPDSFLHEASSVDCLFEDFDEAHRQFRLRFRRRLRIRKQSQKLPINLKIFGFLN